MYYSAASAWKIDIEKYLDDIELVVTGGESGRFARKLEYDWVLSIREQCVRKNVNFEFRQCGTHFVKNGREYTLNTKDLCRQAKLANIDFKIIGNWYARTLRAILAALNLLKSLNTEEWVICPETAPGDAILRYAPAFLLAGLYLRHSTVTDSKSSAIQYQK